MNDRSRTDDANDASSPDEIRAERSPALIELGERLRMLRSRRGLTRKATAATADVSERYLANLEQGIGNPSLLILQQLGNALQCSVAEVIGDATTTSPEWLMLRELLANRSDAELRQARMAVAELFRPGDDRPKARRLALIGLRGAGKSTMGARLAERLNMPFIELSREVERMAGCDIRQIHDLYGANAYRRYERRALDAVIGAHRDAVIATPGGIVSDPQTFHLLLQQTTTIWLQAAPEEHMGRVARQGDLRPMAASREAMSDLRQILAGRAAFHAKADFKVDTTDKTPDQVEEELIRIAVGVSGAHE